MIKGLKKLGILALSAVIAMGTVTAVLPAKEVWADDYVKATGETKIERSQWRFAEGIVNVRKDFEVVDSYPVPNETDDNIIDGWWYHLKLPQSYQWYGSSKVYDIHLSMYVTFFNKDYNKTRLTGTISDFPKSYTSARSDTYKSVNINTNIINLDVVDTSFKQKYAFYDMRIWLQDGNNIVKTTGPDGIPYIVAPVWTGDSEINEVYTADSIYTNIPKESPDKLSYVTVSPGGRFTVSDGIKNSENNYNQAFFYVTGFGHTSNDEIRMGYSQSNNNVGTLEMRAGYRAFSVEYIGDTGIQNGSNYPKTEMVPAATLTNNPSDRTPSYKTVSDDWVITKYTLDSVYYGENYAKVKPGDEGGPVNYVTLNDGTVINAGDPTDPTAHGDEIKPSQIAQIKMDKNVVIYAHTIPKADAAQLIYHFKNDQIPQQPGHTDGDTNLIENYKLYKGTTETEDPTSNGSLKPGVVITGKDDQKYRLVGWFEDEALTDPYEFDENLTEAKYPDKKKHIYAKWELVVDPPKPDPTPEPDSPSDSGSTPAPATVAPAAPAPLPAGTVRVSPKTGDTTIPPIYYVMSVVALAGIGFLVFRRRGKN